MTDRNDNGLPEMNLGTDEPSPVRPRRGRAFLWAFAAVLFSFLLGAAAWPLLAPRLAAWLPPSFLPVYVAGDDVLAEVPGLAARLDELSERVDKLETQGPRRGATADTGPALEALNRRLAALELAAADSTSRNLGLAQQSATEAKAASDTLARLARESAGNAAGLADLEARLAKVEATATATGLAQVAAPLAFALADLGTALTGSAPFGEQLSRVDSLLRPEGVWVDSGRKVEGPVGGPVGGMADGTAEVEKALSDLAGLSSTGVATPDDLARAFPQLARDVLAADDEGESPGWLGKTWARLASVVTVRRVGDVEGDSAEALLARAEARLAEDDLASAVAEVAAIQDAGADVAGPWLEAAEARLRADAALAALNSGLASAFQ